MSTVKVQESIYQSYLRQTGEKGIQTYLRRIYSCQPAGASKKFYLQPIENPTSEVWHKITPVGKDTISSFMKEIKKTM